MTFSRPDDMLRCQARLIEARTAAADMLELIHSGALVPATDDPVLLDRCTEVANRLERSCTPEVLKAIHFHTYQD
jgi:hypothetical protein